MKSRNIVALVIAAVAMLYSCIEIDEFAPKQRAAIESYLSDRYYRITADSAFVCLLDNKFGNVVDREHEGAKKGDRACFNVEAYTFNNSPATKPYYTNKRYLAEATFKGMDLSYWDFEPYVVTIGKGEILKPLDEALEGSLVGDSIAVFLTSSIAYGHVAMGAVPKDTAVMIILTVENEEEAASVAE